MLEPKPDNIEIRVDNEVQFRLFRTQRAQKCENTEMCLSGHAETNYQLQVISLQEGEGLSLYAAGQILSLSSRNQPLTLKCTRRIYVGRLITK